VSTTIDGFDIEYYKQTIIALNPNIDKNFEENKSKSPLIQETQDSTKSHDPQSDRTGSNNSFNNEFVVITKSLDKYNQREKLEKEE
jgi:hypothetical protein